jgi:hypothetical protein
LNVLYKCRIGYESTVESDSCFTTLAFKHLKG